MSLVGAVDVLTDGERARHPGSLAIEAYFDGWNQASGGPPRTYPRYLTRDEEESWRDGWSEAKAEGAEWGDSIAIYRRAPVLLLRRRECAPCPLLAVAA